MSKLVAVYGDGAALERALGALEEAGLSDKTRVVGDGSGSPAGTDSGLRDTRGQPDTAAEADVAGARFIVPPVAAGGSAVPAASPGVLAPLAVPLGGSEGGGSVGSGPGVIDAARELERVTGAATEEASFYADVIKGGGSVLVVEGDDTDLDRAEVALEEHAGQGMTRH